MKNEPKASPSVHHEAYVEEKAERFMFKCPGFPMGDTRAPYLLKDFIRTIVKDCKSKVSMEVVHEWVRKISDANYLNEELQLAIAIMLKEAGVEVEDK